MPFDYFRDLTAALEKRGLLRHVEAEVDKDWELSTVARQVFLRMAEHQRYALQFDRVKGFDMPVVVGAFGGSREIYAAGIDATPGELLERWADALAKPIQPELVADAPCQEIVLTGKDVDLCALPVPVWTPPVDPGPFLTATCVITKDPETGVRNVGTRRMQVKGSNKTGMNLTPKSHTEKHVLANEAAGRNTPCAVALGVEPVVGMLSAARIHYGLDEVAVAGGLKRAPVRLVKAKTMDFEVPASAEIVLEGEILAGVREPEGPFGEMSGHFVAEKPAFVFQVNAITMRRNALLQAWVSQKPPSESTKLRGIAHEGMVYKYLTRDMAISGITDVHCTESSSSHGHLWVRGQWRSREHAQNALTSALTHSPRLGKITAVFDDDIDVRDAFQVDWALAFRAQPDRDVYIYPKLAEMHWDPSTASDASREGYGAGYAKIGGKMAIDATKKWEYTPVSLPPEEMQQQVRDQWSKYGLPPLRDKNDVY
ncbi:MAG TPA: UbiD family decarboxylase [Chloroflexota bacterium]|nr:UbiD family decarboxylase [Chloroflexota bacterium]